MANLRLISRALVALSLFALLSSFAIPSDARDRRDAPNLEPYIDAIDCIEANGTSFCKGQNTSEWPDNATIFRNDSDGGVTEATVKVRMEGKGDRIPNRKTMQAILIMDDTGSMTWNDPDYLRFNASKFFVDQLTIPDEVGFVVYADTLPSGKEAELRSPLTTDYAGAKQGMYGNSNGGTPMINGFQVANDELIPKKKPGFAWVNILLTDGCWGTGGDPQPQVDRAVNEQILIFTIGLYPDPNSSDKQLCEPDLQKWAQQSGGKYYWAEHPEDIAQILKGIDGEFDPQIAGTPPKDGSPMITLALTNSIEVVPGSFGGSPNNRPTKPTVIPQGNRGLRLEWQTPVRALYLKQLWEVTFRIRSYAHGDHVLVNDVSKSYMLYDHYDGSPGGHDPIDQLWLKVLLPPEHIPSEPLDLKGELSAGKIRLSWSPPYSDGFTPILKYDIYRGTSPSEERYVASTYDPSTEYADAGITIGYVFYYQVSAVNRVGEGALSDEVNISTVLPPRAPGSPTMTEACGGIELIDISWEPPTDDGWSPITAYRVYRGIASGNVSLYQTVGPNDGWFRDNWVIPGMTYYYSVSAVNLAGEGERSNELSAVPDEPDDTPSPNGHTISILVKDARTHESLPHAELRLDGEGKVRVTDKWGRLTLSNVPNGRHSLKVYASDHATLARVVTVHGSDLEICFFLVQEEKNSGPVPTTYTFDPQPSAWAILIILLVEVASILFLLKRRRSKWGSRGRV
jgi:hypothetical protein